MFFEPRATLWEWWKARSTMLVIIDLDSSSDLIFENQGSTWRVTKWVTHQPVPGVRVWPGLENTTRTLTPVYPTCNLHGLQNPWQSLFKSSGNNKFQKKFQSIPWNQEFRYVWNADYAHFRLMYLNFWFQTVMNWLSTNQFSILSNWTLLVFSSIYDIIRFKGTCIDKHILLHMARTTQAAHFDALWQHLEPTWYWLYMHRTWCDTLETPSGQSTRPQHTPEVLPTLFCTVLHQFAPPLTIPNVYSTPHPSYHPPMVTWSQNATAAAPHILLMPLAISQDTLPLPIHYFPFRSWFTTSTHTLDYQFAF